MKPITLIAILLSGTPVWANDGWGGLSSTGLTFGQTDAVEMAQEDLFISPDRISVDYLFRNTTGSDVTGEVIFPLPPIDIGAMLMSDTNGPQDRGRENYVDFSATVDGKPVDVAIDRIAVIPEPWEENRPASADYDTPGFDVTEQLEKFGIPLTTDVDVVVDYIKGLDPQIQDQIVEAGLAGIFRGDGSSELGIDIYLNWAIVLRYHWTQTFPAGAEVQISHAYANYPSGGIFGWKHPDSLKDQDYLATQYCVDQGTSAAMGKALASSGAEDAGDGYYYGSSYTINYVLRTANSWAGPIGKFRLTLDKGDAKNVISLCADGVKKTGPTTFVVEKTGFTPDRDLEILVVAPHSF